MIQNNIDFGPPRRGQIRSRMEKWLASRKWH
jgi:hypothetical protein